MPLLQRLQRAKQRTVDATTLPANGAGTPGKTATTATKPVESAGATSSDAAAMSTAEPQLVTQQRDAANALLGRDDTHDPQVNITGGAKAGFIDPSVVAKKLAAEVPEGLRGERIGKSFHTRDLEGHTVDVVIKRFLANGHFGDVYLAEDAHGNRYAAKFLREDRQKGDWGGKPWDPTEESTNLRKAASMHDPRLVGGLGAGLLDGGEPGVLIQWAGDNAKTLTDAWSDPLPSRTPGKAARVVREVLHALSSLHGAGLEHGDVGPTNVMIGASDATSSVRLIDPGNARGVTPEKVQHDLVCVARLLVALAQGGSFDRKMTSAPSNLTLDVGALSSRAANEFQSAAHDILNKAFTGGYASAWAMWEDVHARLCDTRFG